MFIRLTNAVLGFFINAALGVFWLFVLLVVLMALGGGLLSIFSGK
jgi:hypothetical protein